MADADNITQLLVELRAGNADAMARLLPIVYRELRRLAAHYMRQERPGHTLQPTALVHEAYLRLVGQADRNWQNRAHFFAVAAQTMRTVLVDHARANLTRKRGGKQVHVELNNSLNLAAPKPQATLVLDETLRRLEQIDPRDLAESAIAWETTSSMSLART